MRRPSPALVIACIALVSSLTGGAVAAKLISGKQIQDNSITGRDVKDRSIALKDLAANALLAGPKGADGTNGTNGADGAPGPAGPKGDQGAPGPIEGTPAGGALAGTYPNPTLKPGSVGADQIAVPVTVLRKAADENVGSGALATLSWTSEVIDTGAMHDPIGDPQAIRPTVPGVYSVSASLCWAASNLGGYRLMSIAQFKVGGSGFTTSRVHQSVAPATSGRTCTSASGLFRVDADDYLQVEVAQESGITLAIDGGDEPDDGARFSAVWVAPL